MARLVAMLEDAGLVEVYTDEQGREAYRLTENGVRVGNMLAMVEGEDGEEMLQALLSELSADEPGSRLRGAERGPGLAPGRAPCRERATRRAAAQRFGGRTDRDSPSERRDGALDDANARPPMGSGRPSRMFTFSHGTHQWPHRGCTPAHFSYSGERSRRPTRGRQEAQAEHPEAVLRPVEDAAA